MLALSTPCRLAREEETPDEERIRLDRSGRSARQKKEVSQLNKCPSNRESRLCAMVAAMP